MRRTLNAAVEDLSRAELSRLQLQRLLVQLERCRAKVPFYSERWGGATAPRSLEQFREVVPFTSKADFVDGMPEASGRVARGRRSFEHHLTSGTTGLGQEIHPLSSADHEALGAGWQYQAHWAGLEKGDRICFTWPVGLQTGGLSTGIMAQRLGLSGVQLGPYSSQDKRRFLEMLQPQALVASPAYLTHLAHLFLDAGSAPREALPRLKVLFVAGESYPVAWAEEAMAAWGCQISEWYGLMQGGMNQAFSCETGVLAEGGRGHLHNLDHRILSEVLDPETGAPVQPGESGEIVITTLTRDAFPFIRFRSGDRVRVMPEPCRCGRLSLTLEAGTVSRYDDMMKIRGQNLWPAAVDRVVLVDTRVLEYTGVVRVDERGQEVVTLSVELESGVPADEGEAVLTELQRQLKSATNVGMRLLRAEAGSLPRFEFKARRWTDHRRADRNAIRYVAD